MPNTQLNEKDLKNKVNNLEEDISQLKASLDSFPELFFKMNIEGEVTYINKAGLEKFGYTNNDLPNISIKTFFPNDYELVLKNTAKLITGEELDKKQYISVKKNGEEIPVIISANIIYEKNIPVEIQGVIVDISKQKELEYRFQNLFNSTPYSVVIFNPNSGDINMLNPFAEDLFDVDRKALSKENIFYYVNDSGLLTFRNYIKTIKNNEEDVSYNTTISNKEGLERNVKIFCSKIKIHGKEYIQSFFQDTTDSIKKNLKEIEQRKQKELLALSVFQLNNYKDKDSMFKYIAQTLQAFNPKSIVLMGDYLPEKHKLKLNCIVGSKIEKITNLLNIDLSKIELDIVDYPTPENRIFVDIEKMLTNTFYDKVSKVKFTLMKKGLGVKKLFTAKLIINKKILGGISILTANENFLEENEFIEIFISQASIVLDRISYEKQLIDSKEKAIESDRLKSTFLANMSHEIRTPMNSILGFSDLILKGELDEDMKARYSTLMQSSGDILVKLIDDIIDISKIESNQLEVLEEDFNVNEIIKELSLEFSDTKDNIDSQIKLEFINSKGPIRIKSDKSRIKQILINLLNNSIKFTKKGSVKVWFEKAGKQVVFHVKDTGIGINSEKQKIIFDRFRQADESSTRPFRGAGLGLAISKHLANLLGGDILVHSEKNIGTEFIVTILANQKDIVNPSDIYIKPHKPTNSDWSKFTIFIAEDEDSNYYLLEAYLKDTGAKFEWFRNGKELLDRLKKTLPDLILLDLKMPEMDGYTAAAEIKKKYPDLYIIAQTAYAMADEKNKAIKAGCDDFVTKPIKKEVLFYKIAKYLN